MAQKHKGVHEVVVSAEQIAEGEHEGFWLTTDANGVQGRVPDEQFKQNFTLIEDAPKAKASKSGNQ